MFSPNQADTLLVQRIRQGEPTAWTELISRFEGRLLAYVECRLGERGAGEDVVQETFIGFLTSLPNYDQSRSLEGWLFSIAAHKLTDFLRREGRRPAVSLSSAADDQGQQELPGAARRASTIARSAERKKLEEQSLATALHEQIEQWKTKNDWPKVKCMELLFVAGKSNKETSELLGLTEQQVANFKHDFLAKLRKTLRDAGLDTEVFPELYTN